MVPPDGVKISGRLLLAVRRFLFVRALGGLRPVESPVRTRDGAVINGLFAAQNCCVDEIFFRAQDPQPQRLRPLKPGDNHART